MKTTTGAWDANYQKLVSFHKVHKHTNVPRKNEYRMLSKWVSRQRKATTLSQDQMDRLKRIGFSWENKQERDDKAWKERLLRLDKYKRQHGDCLVPQQYEEDLELGTWVANQRRLYNQGKLREDRSKELHELGFVWLTKSARAEQSTKRRREQTNTKYDAKWNVMFQKLEAYKKQYGDCCVPYHFPKDPSLALWVTTQRRNYHQKTWYGKEKTMSKERKEQLDSLGFVWDNSVKKKGEVKA